MDILNDLLTFNKLEAGAFELHREAAPVVTLVERAVGLFQSQVPHRQGSLRLAWLRAYLTHCVHTALPLGGQARDKDITLTVSFPAGSPAGPFRDTPAGTHAVPMLPLLNLPAVAPLTDADVISVDRNKVEQVSTSRCRPVGNIPLPPHSSLPAPAMVR